MIIVYRGWGILVAPIAIIGFLIPMGVEQWTKGSLGFAMPNWMVMGLAALLPFLGMLGLDWLLRRFGPKYQEVDPRTGTVVETPKPHSFMFLPVKWCAYIWIGLAICFAVATLF